MRRLLRILVALMVVLLRSWAILFTGGGSMLIATTQEPELDSRSPVTSQDPALTLPMPEKPVPLLLTRPLLPQIPKAFAETPATMASTPPHNSFQRIHATFRSLDMEWVTPREKLEKLLKASCPGLQLVTDPTQAEAAFETTFNHQTSVWTTVVRQKNDVVDRFHTFAYPGRASAYLAEQVCLRAGHQIEPGEGLNVRLPHGKWEGVVQHQVAGDRADEFSGSITIDDQWVTIRGTDQQVVETRQIPMSGVRDVRTFGEKKGLPAIRREIWDALLRNSYECERGAALCAAGGAAVLGAYTAIRPLINVFVPTQRTLELLFEEDGQPRLLVVRLQPDVYARFVKAVARGSQASYSVVKPVVRSLP